MATVLMYFAFAACVITLGILVFGLGGFGTGKITPRMQNKVMRYRIIAQFIAIILIVLTVLALRGGE